MTAFNQHKINTIFNLITESHVDLVNISDGYGGQDRIVEKLL